jgi:hypothetical protein
MMRKSLIRNVLGCTSALFLISACTATTLPDVVEVKTFPVEKPILTLPASDPIRMREIDWSVITPDNYQEISDLVKSKSGSSALFAVDKNGYENLSKNMNDIRKYLDQQDSIIKAYESYYVKADRSLDKAVTVE